MTREQAVSLIKKHEQIPSEVWDYYWKTKDMEVRNAIMNANEGLMRKLTSQYAYSEDYQDIVQSGYLGLLYAVEHYHDSDAKFSTYAYRCVQGSILDCINELSGLPNRSTAVNKAYACVKKESEPLDSAAKKFGLNSEERAVLANLLLYDNPISLDAPITGDDNTDLENVLMYDTVAGGDGGLEGFVQNETNSDVSEVLTSIASRIMDFDRNPKTREAVERLFGLGGNDTVSQAELADETGVSRQAINQRALKFLRRMKHPRVKKEIRRKLQIPDTVKDCDVVPYLYEK